MQWLTLVSEDAGVQRLRGARPATASTGRLDGVAGYPSAHPAQTGEPRVDRPAARRERRRGERRRNQRRDQQLPVAFDTRSRHDRRGCQDRRCASGQARTSPQLTGIDVYA